MWSNFSVDNIKRCTEIFVDYITEYSEHKFTLTNIMYEKSCVIITLVFQTIENDFFFNN